MWATAAFASENAVSLSRGRSVSAAIHSPQAASAFASVVVRMPEAKERHHWVGGDLLLRLAHIGRRFLNGIAAWLVMSPWRLIPMA